MNNYKRLGDYIRQVNIRNTDLQVTKLLGVSIQKILMPSIANTVGTNMKTYKIIKRNQFAYGPVTSRNGNKISVALLQDFDEAIISQAYTVFEIVDTNKLNPEYLMMWFRRPEFDRFARFKSHGSAREVFDWEEMCDTTLPIPGIEKQNAIVAEYKAVVNRIKLNEQLNQKLEETAQAIYKHWFVDFEFPNEEGKPYKSSGGKMVWNEELEKDVPEGWEVQTIGSVISVKDGTHDSPKPSSNGFPLITSTHLKKFDIAINEAYLINKEDYKQINKRSKVEQFDILFSMIGTVGAINYVQNREINFAIKNVGLFKSSEKKMLSDYIFLYLKSQYTNEYIGSSLAGSTQSYVTLTTLRNIPLLLPKFHVISNFNNKVLTIIRTIYSNSILTNKLLDLRDLLLSKMTKVEIVKTLHATSLRENQRK